MSVTDGQYVDAGAEIAVVTDGARLTLRADLPVDMAAMIPSVTSARVRGAGQSDVVDLSALNGRKESSRSVAGDGVSPSAMCRCILRLTIPAYCSLAYMPKFT